MTDLDAERDTVDRALVAAGLTWSAWPEAVVAASVDRLGWSARERLAALLVLLATPGHRPTTGDDGRRETDPADDAIDRLSSLDLPWDAGTARLALEVVAEGGFEERRVAVALRAAAVVCAAGEADADLSDELRTFTAWLDALALQPRSLLRWRREAWRVLGVAPSAC